MQPRVLRFVDDAHSAGTQARDYFVRPKLHAIFQSSLPTAGRSVLRRHSPASLACVLPQLALAHSRFTPSGETPIPPAPTAEWIWHGPFREPSDTVIPWRILHQQYL